MYEEPALKYEREGALFYDTVDIAKKWDTFFNLNISRSEGDSKNNSRNILAAAPRLLFRFLTCSPTSWDLAVLLLCPVKAVFYTLPLNVWNIVKIGIANLFSRAKYRGTFNTDHSTKDLPAYFNNICMIMLNTLPLMVLDAIYLGTQLLGCAWGQLILKLDVHWQRFLLRGRSNQKPRASRLPERHTIYSDCEQAGIIQKSSRSYGSDREGFLQKNIVIHYLDGGVELQLCTKICTNAEDANTDWKKFAAESLKKLQQHNQFYHSLKFVKVMPSADDEASLALMIFALPYYFFRVMADTMFYTVLGLDQLVERARDRLDKECRQHLEDKDGVKLRLNRRKSRQHEINETQQEMKLASTDRCERKQQECENKLNDLHKNSNEKIKNGRIIYTRRRSVIIDMLVYLPAAVAQAASSMLAVTQYLFLYFKNYFMDVLFMGAAEVTLIGLESLQLDWFGIHNGNPLYLLRPSCLTALVHAEKEKPKKGLDADLQYTKEQLAKRTDAPNALTGCADVNALSAPEAGSRSDAIVPERPMHEALICFFNLAQFPLNLIWCLSVYLKAVFDWSILFSAFIQRLQPFRNGKERYATSAAINASFPTASMLIILPTTLVAAILMPISRLVLCLNHLSYGAAMYLGEALNNLLWQFWPSKQSHVFKLKETDYSLTDENLEISPQIVEKFSGIANLDTSCLWVVEPHCLHTYPLCISRAVVYTHSLIAMTLPLLVLSVGLGAWLISGGTVAALLLPTGMPLELFAGSAAIYGLGCTLGLRFLRLCRVQEHTTHWSKAFNQARAYQPFMARRWYQVPIMATRRAWRRLLNFCKLGVKDTKVRVMYAPKIFVVTRTITAMRDFCSPLVEFAKQADNFSSNVLANMDIITRGVLRDWITAKWNVRRWFAPSVWLKPQDWKVDWHLLKEMCQSKLVVQTAWPGCGLRDEGSPLSAELRSAIVSTKPQAKFYINPHSTTIARPDNTIPNTGVTAVELDSEDTFKAAGWDSFWNTARLITNRQVPGESNNNVFKAVNGCVLRKDSLQTPLGREIMIERSHGMAG